MMKVQRRMQRQIYTVQKDDPIERAQTLMSAHNIRHLPVLEGGRLVGMLSERDIRAMLIPHGPAGGRHGQASFYLPSEIRVRDAMTKDPISVAPGSDIEEAARILVENKIGGLPVVENGDVVGIITETDILWVFCEMMGFLESSCRLDVTVGDEPDGLERVSEIIRRRGGRIISVGMLPASQAVGRIHFFRLAACDTGPIIADLRKAGYGVTDDS